MPERQNIFVVSLEPEDIVDLELLLNGGYAPLSSYLGQADHEAVLSRWELADGTFWPAPVCLSVSGELGNNLNVGCQLSLRDLEGYELALLTVSEFWQPDFLHESSTLAAGPALADRYSRLADTGSYYVTGSLSRVAPVQYSDFHGYRAGVNWQGAQSFNSTGGNVLAVMTSIPLHKPELDNLVTCLDVHEASAVICPIISPSLYFETAHFTLVKCLQHCIEQIPEGRGRLLVQDYDIQGKGERSLPLFAMALRNLGCTHILLSSELVDLSGMSCTALSEKLQKAGLTSVFSGDDGMDSSSFPEVLSSRDDSHSKVVACLESNQPVPPALSFPRVVEILGKRHKPLHRKGFAVLFTGLAGAGKSTLAKILFVRLQELQDRPVTLLDGDIVRRNLSSELNFSKEHRELNVTRIGFVASEIVKNGGIAICAPIAPYPESRRVFRRMVEMYGGFFEMHVSTPLEVCEQRDPKGIYAKGRAGVIKGLTGVSAPYTPPECPSLRIDTSSLLPDACVEMIFKTLYESGYVLSPEAEG